MALIIYHILFLKSLLLKFLVVHFGLQKQKACQIKMVVQYDEQHNVPSQTCKIGQNPSIHGGFTIHCNPQSVSIIYGVCLTQKTIEIE